ncbi:hypothetical protein ES703_113849 [subsurface metagenome]
MIGGVRKFTFVFVIAMLLGLAVSPVHAQPPLPHAFYGSLEVNGSPAEPGYVIEAIVEDYSPGEGNPITTTELGKYGGSGGLDPKLVVQGDIEDGAPITFFVNGVEAETDPAVVEWHSGLITQVDLAVTITRPPGGGGGGIPAPDRTPPRISNVLLCPEGVTETTADICWTTHEKSTSQVEYWTSPSMLSPLDETLVIQHHVQLTGLTPGTKYYYKTMSMDRAENLAVSDEYTFTTLGKAPAAAFTTSNLSVSPSEVNVGESVTISVLVTNTGNLAGSYEVTFKIDGVAVASEEVTLAAGGSETVTFTAAKDVADSYSVNVNGLTGSFTVIEEVAPAPPAPAAPAPPAPPAPAPPLPSAINWAIVAPIIAVAVFLAIFLPLRQRRRRAG